MENETEAKAVDADERRKRKRMKVKKDEGKVLLWKESRRRVWDFEVDEERSTFWWSNKRDESCWPKEEKPWLAMRSPHQLHCYQRRRRQFHPEIQRIEDREEKKDEDMSPDLMFSYITIPFIWTYVGRCSSQLHLSSPPAALIFTTQNVLPQKVCSRPYIK
jgi:hypothetical protein